MFHKGIPTGVEFHYQSMGNSETKTAQPTDNDPNLIAFRELCKRAKKFLPGDQVDDKNITQSNLVEKIESICKNLHSKKTSLLENHEKSCWNKLNVCIPKNEDKDCPLNTSGPDCVCGGCCGIAVATLSCITDNILAVKYEMATLGPLGAGGIGGVVGCLSFFACRAGLTFREGLRVKEQDNLTNLIGEFQQLKTRFDSYHSNQI